MSQVIAVEARVPSPVNEFCSARRLLPHLQLALRLAEANFDGVKDVQVELETDPETDEQAVVITIVMATSVDDAVSRKQAYTRAWVDAAPPEVIDQIRVLLDIH